MNAKGVKDELKLVEEAASQLDVIILQYIPRDELVQVAKNRGETVIETYGNSDMACIYRQLACAIIESCCDEIAV